MKNTYNTLTCLFGHHDYSEELTRDKDGHKVYLCKICKRSGYTKWYDGSKVYHDYDEKRNCIRRKYSDASEVWYTYDKEGNLVTGRFVGLYGWRFTIKK